MSHQTEETKKRIDTAIDNLIIAVGDDLTARLTRRLSHTSRIPTAKDELLGAIEADRSANRSEAGNNALGY